MEKMNRKVIIEWLEENTEVDLYIKPWPKKIEELSEERLVYLFRDHFFDRLNIHGSSCCSTKAVREILKIEDLKYHEKRPLFKFVDPELKEDVRSRFNVGISDLIIFGASCPSAIKAAKKILEIEEWEEGYNYRRLIEIVEFIPSLSIRAAEKLLGKDSLEVLGKALKLQT